MPIYTYMCEKCKQEFDIQHAMGENYHNCSEIKKSYNCDGELKRAMHIPVNTKTYVPPTGVDLEYRIRKGIEEAALAVKQDRNKKMKVTDKEISEKVKNGK